MDQILVIHTIHTGEFWKTNAENFAISPLHSTENVRIENTEIFRDALIIIFAPNASKISLESLDLSQFLVLLSACFFH